MATAKVYGVLIDRESSTPRTVFDIAKFDSDPWAKKNMKWDSEAGLGESIIGHLLANAVDSKILTIQLKTDLKVYSLLRKANKLKSKDAGKEGGLDYFQLNIVIEGKRRSVRFDQPVLELYKPLKENDIDYMIFTIKTSKKPTKDGGEL